MSKARLLIPISGTFGLYPVQEFIEISANMRRAEFRQWDWYSRRFRRNKDDWSEICLAHDKFPNIVEAVL